MKKIKEILFGRLPRIFSPSGEVQHELRKSRWSQWKSRYTKSLDYNWKRHSGKTQPRSSR